MRILLRLIAISFLVIFMALGPSLAAPTNNERHSEEIVGFVVAYDEIQAWIPCYDSACEGSLIVRTQQERDPVYIRVNLKYRAGKFPRELIKSKQMWRFKLERTQPLDEPVYENLIQDASPYSPQKKYTIWKLVPGAEQEKLPFEQTIPSYVLVKGGMKLMKNQLNH